MTVQLKCPLCQEDWPSGRGQEDWPSGRGWTDDVRQLTNLLLYHLWLDHDLPFYQPNQCFCRWVPPGVDTMLAHWEREGGLDAHLLAHLLGVSHG